MDDDAEMRLSATWQVRDAEYQAYMHQMISECLAAHKGDTMRRTLDEWAKLVWDYIDRRDAGAG